MRSTLIEEMLGRSSGACARRRLGADPKVEKWMGLAEADPCWLRAVRVMERGEPQGNLDTLCREAVGGSLSSLIRLESPFTTRRKPVTGLSWDRGDFQATRTECVVTLASLGLGGWGGRRTRRRWVTEALPSGFSASHL